jgi:acetyl-CoA synthetase
MSKINIDWLKLADRITWFKKPTQAGNFSYNKPVSIKWYEDGELNVSYNCIDRHLPSKANQVALIWEPDNPQESAKKITYQELSHAVNRFANILKRQNVKKGDRVTIYMPMIPE